MIIVSACLAGIKCKYNGESNPCEKVIELVKQGKAVPICPEQLGGLTTPRSYSEQKEGKVVTIRGDLWKTLKFQFFRFLIFLDIIIYFSIFLTNFGPSLGTVPKIQ